MKNLEPTPKHAHLVTAAPAILSVLAACARLTAPLPGALDPGADQRALLQVSASGVQVYECRVGSAPGTSAWMFVAPEAQLFDAGGHGVGQHGAGPFWMANDGSRIVGTLRARMDAPDAGAIPWLLLRTHSTGGPGAFEHVTNIVRLNTEGGAAPASGCTPDSTGVQVRVPYRADYRFYTPA